MLLARHISLIGIALCHVLQDDIFVNHDKAQFLLVSAACICPDWPQSSCFGALHTGS